MSDRISVQTPPQTTADIRVSPGKVANWRAVRRQGHGPRL